MEHQQDDLGLSILEKLPAEILTIVLASLSYQEVKNLKNTSSHFRKHPEIKRALEEKSTPPQLFLCGGDSVVHAIFLLRNHQLYGCASSSPMDFPDLNVANYNKKPILTIPAKLSNEKILKAAFGKTFGFFVTEKGVIGAGSNSNWSDDSCDHSTKLLPLTMFDDKKILDIACGPDFAFIVTTTGVFGIPSNLYGQLGYDGWEKIAKITALDDKSILKIVCGFNHTLFVTKQGLHSCGSNEFGQLGLDFSIAKTHVPTLIPFFSDKKILLVSCGNSSSIVATDKGVYGFGRNNEGQLGFGNRTSNNSPQLIPAFNNHKIKLIKCGGNFSNFVTYFVTDKGIYFCSKKELTPKLIPNFTDELITDIICAPGAAIFVTISGKMFAWGAPSIPLQISDLNQEIRLHVNENSVETPILTKAFDVPVPMKQSSTIFADVHKSNNHKNGDDNTSVKLSVKK